MNTDAKPVTRSHAAAVHAPGLGKLPGGGVEAGLFAGLLDGLSLGTAAGCGEDDGAATGADLTCCADATTAALQAQALLAQMTGVVANRGAVTTEPAGQAAQTAVVTGTTVALPGAAEDALAGDRAASGRAVGIAELADSSSRSESSAKGAGAARNVTLAMQGGARDDSTGQAAVASDPAALTCAAQSMAQGQPGPNRSLLPHGARASHTAPITGAGHSAADTDRAAGDSLRQVWQAAPMTAVVARDSTPSLAIAAGITPGIAPRERERERADAASHKTDLTGLGMASTAEPLSSMSLATPNAVNAAAATLAATPTDIAQQFQYWINSDVQSAELQVDGMGAEPVQVQISLSGNEAQVVFRTDQAQTRELLGQALGTLDHMLRSQGITLTGGWIGGSGGRGQSSAYGGQGANPRVAGVGAIGAQRAAAVTGVSAVSVHGTDAVGGVDCFA